MHVCPHCFDAPTWYFARNVSHARKADHWILSGCRHLEAFLGGPTIIANADRDAFEGRWDAEAQRLFDVYTYAWTDADRDAFRERIWPTPPPVIPSELFDRAGQPNKVPDVAAVKAWNAAHPASDEDESGYI